MPGGRARRARRAVVLAACLLVTGALHLAALEAVRRVIGLESLGRRAAAAPVRSVRLMARDAPAATARPSPGRGPVPAAPADAGTRGAEPPSAPRVTDLARPGTSPEAPVHADAGADGYRFYNAKEVDVTAEPVLDWNLDPAELDALATSRIVFTLFVGRDGSILHCSVDEPERLSPAQRQALERRLADTAMRPARLAGSPVPSRRRVELFTVGG